MTDVQMFDSQLKFSNDNGVLTDIAFLFLHQLWTRSGGFTDAISESTASTDSELYYWNTPSLDIFEQIISTAANITAYGNAVIVATASITVTLNPNPIDKEKITIKRITTLGSVTVDGGVINIDGATTYELITNYESAQCIYSIADDEWLIV